MAKPTTKIAWTPTGAAVVDPGGAKKAAGWAPEEKPPAEWFNWLFLHISNWIDYLDVLAGQAFTWTVRHAFNAGIDVTATNAPAVTGTAVSTGDGLHGIGAGPNAGVAGYGGTTSGPGGWFLGGAPNGLGAVGSGTGTGRGVQGTGGADGGGAGVVGFGGGGNADGVEGFAAGNGNGVTGYGGPTDGSGGAFAAGGNGVGVVGTGSGTGPGVRAFKGAGATNAIEANGNISAGGHNVVSVADPVNDDDAATKAFVVAAAAAAGAAASPGAWIAATNGFSAVNVKSRMEPGNIVRFRGPVYNAGGWNASSGVLLTLTAAHWPATVRRVFVPIFHDATIGTTVLALAINTNGQVTVDGNTSQSGFVYFDASFPTVDT